MKKILIGLILALVLTGCTPNKQPRETLPPSETIPAAVPETLPPVTTEETQPTATTEETQPPVVLELTQEEQDMLLKLGMAELGHTECAACVALVMRTVINRVESDRFSKSIYSVIHAQDQFTPVMDGTYEAAIPNDTCFEALDMVLHGWDESQGALFYEFCEGESWHSRNLTLLTSHCNTHFYK